MGGRESRLHGHACPRYLSAQMNTMSFSLHGKIAVVTGANTGLGRGIANALALAGADIAVGRSSASDTEREVRAAGRSFSFVRADLSHSGESQRIVAEAVQAAGSIDILVNNAGLIRRDDALSFTETDWDAALDESQDAVLPLAGRAKVMPHRARRQNHQHRVDVVVSGRHPHSLLYREQERPGRTDPVAPKSNEWAARGIVVNAIAPVASRLITPSALRADDQRNRDILSQTRPKPAAGARPQISAALRFSWRPLRRITFTGRFFLWTVDGWRDNGGLRRGRAKSRAASPAVSAGVAGWGAAGSGHRPSPGRDRSCMIRRTDFPAEPCIPLHCPHGSAVQNRSA